MLCKHGPKRETYIEVTRLKDGSPGYQVRCKTCRTERRRALTDSFHVAEKREPTIEELAQASVKTISWSELGRRCGMSDNAVRKRARTLGLLDD